MTATMDRPSTADTPTYTTGALVSLGDTCPVRVLSWDDQGAWCLERTRFAPPAPGLATYRVLAPVADPEAFQAALDGIPLADPDTPVTTPTFDSDELTMVVMGLLSYHRDHKPYVFDTNCWAALDAVMAQDPDATDAEVIGALEYVLEEQDPVSLTRDGWIRVTDLVDTYHAACV